MPKKTPKKAPTRATVEVVVSLIHTVRLDEAQLLEIQDNIDRWGERPDVAIRDAALDEARRRLRVRVTNLAAVKKVLADRQENR